jgi:UDP-N-acetyl-D-mannosaminuronic acid dehydrogenase
MAFKGDSDDIRDSLSYKLKKLFEVECKEVLCTDPFVPDPELVPLDEAVRQADVIVLAAPHSAYRDLQIPADKIVVDIWNYWPGRRRDSVRPVVAVAAGEHRS